MNETDTLREIQHQANRITYHARHTTARLIQARRSADPERQEATRIDALYRLRTIREAAAEIIARIDQATQEVQP